MAKKPSCFIKNTIFFWISFLITINLFSQNRNITYSDQYWFQYFLQLNLAPKWTVTGDGGIRFKNAFQETAFTFGRIGLQYKVNNFFSLAVGGAYFTQNTNNRISREEWRGWQEFIMKNGVKRIIISNRIRTEERSFHTLATGKDNFNFRARYRLYLTIPVNHTSFCENTLFFIIGDEVFFNFGNEIIYNYDHNRAIAGIGFKFNDAVTVNFNYTSMYIQKNSALNFEYADMFLLAVSNTFEVKKKAKATSAESTKP